MKYRGFTLAELLISIIVIGTIVAITLPNMLTSTMENEYQTNLKRVYSDLSNAIDAAVTATNGKLRVGVGDGATNASYTNDFRTDLSSYLGFISEGTSDYIFRSNGQPINYKFYGSNTVSNTYIGGTTYASAVLKNGMFLRFVTYGNCSQAGVNACGAIHVDINGAAGPNEMGKDYYGFWVTLNGDVYSLVPMGGPGSTMYTGCENSGPPDDTSKRAFGCTYARLYNQL